MDQNIGKYNHIYHDNSLHAGLYFYILLLSSADTFLCKIGKVLSGQKSQKTWLGMYLKVKLLRVE